jgi:hypothetical protein
MKKLLFQFDTDVYPSVFDTVVAYDGGADRVTGFGSVTPEKVTPLVEGAIFTRSPKEKKNTAIFIGGSDVDAGQKLFAAVQKHFFPGFQVSVMLDSNGSNTTAAAGVAKLLSSGALSGKQAVVLAGTGPVGQRVAAMLAMEGADVTITSRNLGRAEHACQMIKKRFGVIIAPSVAKTHEQRAEAIIHAQVVFATGAAGIELICPEHWQNNDTIEIMVDANATPPTGIGGTDMMDKGLHRHGKIIWGAIGFGALKLALHRHCISQLFENNNLVLDAEEIFCIAKSLTFDNT